MNKLDAFRVTDSNSPIDVKYVSFAGYDSAPTEFYYNCTTAPENYKDHLEIVKNIQAAARQNISGIEITTDTNKTSFQSPNNPSMIKIVYDNVSTMDLILLVLSFMNMSMSALHLYCIYLIYRYLNS